MPGTTTIPTAAKRMAEALQLVWSFSQLETIRLTVVDRQGFTDEHVVVEGSVYEGTQLYDHTWIISNGLDLALWIIENVSEGVGGDDGKGGPWETKPIFRNTDSEAGSKEA